jgi:hypothetical protein
VEVVGIVSRLAAIDAYVRGVGSAEEPLPDAVAGEPARSRNPDVRLRQAFVPTHPEDGARYALSAVPAEEDDRDRLHAQLYLSMEQMGDLTYQGLLSRAQMELMAARVSLLTQIRDYRSAGLPSRSTILMAGPVWDEGRVDVRLSHRMGGGSDGTPGCSGRGDEWVLRSAGAREALQSWQDGGQELLAGR